MNVLVFDIETVPDVEFARRAYGLDGLPDAEVAKAMFARRRQQTGGEFLPHAQQRVVAISCALRTRDSLTLWSLGEPDSTEAELVGRFFEGIERYTPDLVSWNGGGFDLPVLHYRALVAGIEAPTYWETGDANHAFRFNNYLSRYHWRHVDLMDVLSGMQVRARTSLEDMAQLLGLPGKLGFSGAQVWQAWCAGEIVAIRRYCETDVLNTWLVYLHFERLRGRLSRDEFAAEVERVRVLLTASGEPHHAQFLAAWKTSKQA